ncbi:MAG: DNA-binding protein [Limnobacter sp.]|uniref:DNA-binding protein n=1 Tax=Limnobacter sp. TaxID=2003368 RepID=UPI0039189B12
MNNSRIQYKDVEAAIAALLADGQKVTNDTILAKLGRGSKSTIHKHFRAWQESQPQPKAEERKLPESIFKAIVKEIDEVETRAVATLKAELAEVQHNADELASAGEQLEERVLDLETQLSTVNEEKAKLSAVLEEKENGIKKLEADKLTLQTAIDRLTTDLAKAELKLEGFGELKAEHKETLAKLQAALIEAAELRGKNQPKKA